MLSQNRHYTEDYFIESFLSGLKEEIANALYITKPSTLRDAIDQAREQEAYLESLDKRHQATSKPMVGNHTSGNKPTPATAGNHTPSNKPVVTTPKGPYNIIKGEGQKSYPIKRLTIA